MTEKERKVLLTFADCNMRLTETGERLHYHRNSVEYILKRIHQKTGLDPRKFYDLLKLLWKVTEYETDKV